jgi:hypothetical protein
MARKVRSATFVAQLKEQLAALRSDEHGYRAMQLYAAGVPEPWEFTAEDDFEFYEETGVLVVRDGPTNENGHDNARVPEYVFRLEAIVASQLV